MESASVYDHKQPAWTKMFMLSHTEKEDCLSCVVDYLFGSEKASSLVSCCLFGFLNRMWTGPHVLLKP